MDHESLISGILPILFPAPREGFAITSPVSGVLKKVHSELEIEWKISNAFTADQNIKCFVSPSFQFVGAEWRLLIFGKFPINPDSVSDDPIDDPSLVLLRNAEYCSAVEYTFHLKNLDGNAVQLFKKVMRSDQKRGDYCCIKLSEILQQNADLVPRDITITFSVKLETVDEDSPQQQNLQRLGTLSTNFRELFSNQHYYDTTLHVKGKEYKAHKSVLVARSSVFASIFQYEMSGNTSAIITLSDCDPDCFEKFLEYLYSGKIEAVSPAGAFALYEIAVKYDVEELKAFCCEYLAQCLTAENLCDVVMFAEKFADDNLMSAAQVFFKENFQNVRGTSGWDCLLVNNNFLANRLLKSSF